MRPIIGVSLSPAMVCHDRGLRMVFYSLACFIVSHVLAWWVVKKTRSGWKGYGAGLALLSVSILVPMLAFYVKWQNTPPLEDHGMLTLVTAMGALGMMIGVSIYVGISLLCLGCFAVLTGPLLGVLTINRMGKVDAP